MDSALIHFKDVDAGEPFKDFFSRGCPVSSLLALGNWTFLRRLISTRVWIRLGDDSWQFPYFCKMRCPTVNSSTNVSPRVSTFSG